MSPSPLSYETPTFAFSLVSSLGPLLGPVGRPWGPFYKPSPLSHETLVCSGAALGTSLVVCKTHMTRRVAFATLARNAYFWSLGSFGRAAWASHGALGVAWVPLWDRLGPPWVPLGPPGLSFGPLLGSFGSPLAPFGRPDGFHMPPDVAQMAPRWRKYHLAHLVAQMAPICLQMSRIDS